MEHSVLQDAVLTPVDELPDTQVTGDTLAHLTLEHEINEVVKEGSKFSFKIYLLNTFGAYRTTGDSFKTVKGIK